MGLEFIRDPGRVDIVLEVIKKYWKRNPSMRLCQLLGNCFATNDLYFIEDDELVEELEKAYEGRLNNE